MSAVTAGGFWWPRHKAPLTSPQEGLCPLFLQDGDRFVIAQFLVQFLFAERPQVKLCHTRAYYPRPTGCWPGPMSATLRANFKNRVDKLPSVMLGLRTPPRRNSGLQLSRISLWTATANHKRSYALTMSAIFLDALLLHVVQLIL